MLGSWIARWGKCCIHHHLETFPVLSLVGHGWTGKAMQRLAHVLEPILCHRPHPSALRNNQCSVCKIKKGQLGKKRVNLGTALTAILAPGPNCARSGTLWHFFLLRISSKFLKTAISTMLMDIFTMTMVQNVFGAVFWWKLWWISKQLIGCSGCLSVWLRASKPIYNRNWWKLGAYCFYKNPYSDFPTYFAVITISK